MTDPLPAAVRAIDPVLLSEVARQAVRAATFELRDWSVTALRHEKSIETTGGLYCYRGQGWDGRALRPWSAILKIVMRPDDGCQDPPELCYWRRELLAYQSGLLARLPSGTIRAPRCYGARELEKEAWIWLENIQEGADPGRQPVWEIADHQQAARRLGQFSGAYLVGTPLPDEPWLCGSLLRGMLADDGWWARFINPDLIHNAWQRPAVQALFPEPDRARVLQIWAEKWRFLAAYERLPRVFCHNDAHRRNLMLRRILQDQADRADLAAIDWSFCGPGALGSDMGQFIGTSLAHLDVEPDQALIFEAAALAGYQAGLRDAGWQGNPDLARLGYWISLALYWGATLPHAAVQLVESPVDVVAKYGRPVEAVLEGWRALAGLALDRADEARKII